MCWAERCCFFIKLDLGSVVIGLISIMLSTVMVATSAVYLSIDVNVSSTKALSQEKYLTKILSLELTPNQKLIILCLVLAMGLSMLFASIMLMIGISKRKPSFILFYFAFGIFFTIFSKLGALLLLIETHWELSLVIFVTSGIYIHFLVVIHTLYDQMLHKGEHGFAPHEVLIEDDNISTASQETGILAL